jgi:hypothetical protein
MRGTEEVGIGKKLSRDKIDNRQQQKGKEKHVLQ